MIPHFIPDKITKATPTEMLSAFDRAWRTKFATAPELDSILLLLGHWDVETGGGASMHCWNVGNAKGSEGDGRCWTNFRCDEEIDGVRVWFDPPHPQTRFRAFETLEEGVADYLNLLYKRFSLSWPAVIAGDPEEFAYLLSKQNYYSAKSNAYAKELRRRFDLHKKKATQAPKPVALELDLDDPKVLQETLIALGYDLGASGADGHVGPKTLAAVKAFQKVMGLTPDGMVGAKTKAKLLEAWAAYS